ncbi:DNL zinc finger-domain-containing protein [Pestalotiopsis sp. NC0098]|nr:DNL zinc finger-domain-containing protein [Pestalotiopsis sp. NC0098]
MASKRISSVFNSLLRSSRAPSPFLSTPLLRPYPRLPRTLQPGQVVRRYAHQIPKPGQPSPPAGQEAKDDSQAKTRKQLEPHYELTFTCVPCGSRSSHTISKQGYHKGSVLITCPSCRNRHIISDHLNIFGDRQLTIEDIMRERGQLVKRGTLGVDGDIEFWEDGTQTPRGSGNAGTGQTGEAASPETSTEAEDATKAREARDPSTSAATPSAPTTPNSSLSPGGARPQLSDGHGPVDTPSTKRQFHQSSASRRWFNGVRDDELDDLRSSLRGESPPPRNSFSNGPAGFTIVKEPGRSDTDLHYNLRHPGARKHLRVAYSRDGVLHRLEEDPLAMRESSAAKESPAEDKPVAIDELTRDSPSKPVRKDPKKVSTRSVLAWAPGASEAVRVQLDAEGNIIWQENAAIRRVERPPGSVPLFRKIPMYTNDEGKSEVVRSQQVPGEKYERITRGFESARQLPPQKVQFAESDMLESEVKKDSDSPM